MDKKDERRVSNHMIKTIISLWRRSPDKVVILLYLLILLLYSICSILWLTGLTLTKAYIMLVLGALITASGIILAILSFRKIRV